MEDLTSSILYRGPTWEILLQGIYDAVEACVEASSNNTKFLYTSTKTKRMSCKLAFISSLMALENFDQEFYLNFKREVEEKLIARELKDRELSIEWNSETLTVVRDLIPGILEHIKLTSVEFKSKKLRKGQSVASYAKFEEDV